jgi:hypothetical protein
MDRITRTEIFFLDARLTALDSLIAQLPDVAHAFVIDPDKDGFDQIQASLESFSNVDAVHIVSHGADGAITLGETTLTSGNIDLYSEALLSIGSHLTDSADILVYGCDVAQSASGKQLIDRIAELTGADVTASDDTTGATALGGDWDLEYQAGEIESDILSPAAYSETLAAPTISNLDPSFTFLEGSGTPVIVDSDIAFTDGGSYTDGFLRFSVSSPLSGDSFVLTSSGTPTANGAISVVGSDVFLGDGTTTKRIGSIDAVENGQNGQPLKILFSSPLPNAGFEEGESDWTVVDAEYGDNAGEIEFDGYTVPLATDSAYSGGTGTVNIQLPDGTTFNGSVADGQGIDGSKALFLQSGGSIQRDDQDAMAGFKPDGYGSIHGPYATSSVITVEAGDSISLEFKAVGSGDDYEVFGLLRKVKVDGSGNFIDDSLVSGNNVVLFAERGEDTGGYKTVTKAGLDAGNYRFEFVGGTYDGSGGLVVGSNLYVDNIRLISGTGVNDSVVSTIARQVQYESTDNDTPPSRTVTIEAVNQNGESSTDTITLDITQANNSPLFTDNATLASIGEGNTDPAGASVSSLFASLFSDPDSTHTPPDVLDGVAVVADKSGAEGTWEYSTDAGSSWYAIGTVSNDAALLLSSTSLVRFVPADPDWSGTPGSLSVHAVDSSAATVFTGATRQTFDTTTDDGDSAVSAGSVNLNTQVTAVNDDPTASNIPTGALSILEEASTSVDLSGMTIADIDAGGSNVTLKVVASSGTLTATSGGNVTAGGSGTGTLTLTGTLTDLNTYISNNAAIIYQGATNVSGTESLSLYLNDNGNTGSGGGVDVEIGSGLTVNITAVNDAPYGTTDTLDLNEDQPHTFTVADFGFSDTVDTPADDLAGVVFTSVPAAGTLTLNGTAVSAYDEVSVADIQAGNLVYTPASNEFGAGYSSLSFRVRDDGGTANGGDDLADTANTLTFDVATVADTPTITSTLTQNGQQSTDGLVVSRSTADGAEVTHFKITNITNGTLYQNDGTTPIINGDFITFAQANAGLKFTPSSYLNGSFDIQGSTTNNDSGLGEAPTTATIIVNRPPELTSGNGNTGSYDHGENSSVVATITATDPDNDALTFSLSGGADQSRFSINPTTGELSFNANPDYETPVDQGHDNTYEITVTVADGKGGSDSQDISITVEDRNDTPVIVNPADAPASTISVAENTIFITDVDGFDQDGDTLNYAITGGADADWFTIDPHQGILRFTKGQNFEQAGDENGDGVYEVEYTVTDPEGASDTQTLRVRVIDDNEAPTLSSQGGTGAAQIYAPEGSTYVMTVTGHDVDGDAMTYSVAGEDGHLFAMNAETGVLSFKTPPDFESPADADNNNQYRITNVVTDSHGLQGTQNVVVYVQNVNEAPFFDGNADFSGLENEQPVILLGGNDPDGDALTYRIVGGEDAGAFTISSGGTLSLIQTPDYEAPADANADNVYQVEIEGRDAGGLSYRQMLTYTVEDAAEAPVILTGESELSGIENSTDLGQIDAIDPESGGSLTYRISGGDDGTLFQIDTGGVLRFISAPDYEQPGDADADNEYQVEVTVTNASGEESSRLLTISVGDVDDTGSGEQSPPDTDIPSEEDWDTLPDDDGDGIPEQVEDFVTSPSGEANGDGNGDGIRDSEQQHVTSVPFRHTEKITENPDAPVVFVTLETGVGQAGGSATVQDAKQADEPDDKPSDIEMPLGLIDFNATTDNIGGLESFSLFVDGDIRLNGYYKQNAEGDWVNIANNIERVGDKIRIDFNIRDGGEFDEDGIANGVIVDPGAIGYQVPAAITADDQLATLYINYYDRAPDAEGYAYWKSLMDHEGWSFYDISEGFYEHPKFQQDYEGLTNEEIATKLYFNTFGLEGEQSGIEFWAEQLESRPLYEVVADFSVSALSLDLTALYEQGVLTDEVYSLAFQRQNVLKNLVKTSLDFVDIYGESTTPQLSAELLDNDPAYKAAIAVLEQITHDPISVYDTKEQLLSLVGTDDSMQGLLELWGV